MHFAVEWVKRKREKDPEKLEVCQRKCMQKCMTQFKTERVIEQQFER